MTHIILGAPRERRGLGPQPHLNYNGVFRQATVDDRDWTVARAQQGESPQTSCGIHDIDTRWTIFTRVNTTERLSGDYRGTPCTFRCLRSAAADVCRRCRQSSSLSNRRDSKTTSLPSGETSGSRSSSVGDKKGSSVPVGVNFQMFQSFPTTGAHLTVERAIGTTST